MSRVRWTRGRGGAVDRSGFGVFRGGLAVCCSLGAVLACPGAVGLGRFAIGDRDAMTYNPDGSLDIYIQHANPGDGKVSNWLPAPTGPLGITMPLYLPRGSVFTGQWVPPPVRNVG